MSAPSALDRVTRDSWYVIAAENEILPGTRRETILLETPIVFARDEAGHPAVRRGDLTLPLCRRFGYIWTSLGAPDRAPFEIDQYDEPDRRNFHAGTFALRAAAPRVIENFLDLGHFAFVHTNFLGVEPHTEIKPYAVKVTHDPDEVIATGCRVYQPLASLAATQGFDVAYIYRVPHPTCAVLYKSSGADPTRDDVVGIFVQPVTHETSIAHLFLCLIDDVNEDVPLKAYQQLIFGQDRPILENQLPARLPLDPRAEIPARVDTMSVAYRRWLSDHGIAFGTVPMALPLAQSEVSP